MGRKSRITTPRRLSAQQCPQYGPPDVAIRGSRHCPQQRKQIR